MSSLRGIQQPELSKRLYKLIKTENHAIGAFESAGRETSSIASQLSEWGESTEDDAISEVSDKLAVLLAEIADQEDLFAQNLEESRGVLKQIRNTESSVQPSRNQKSKVIHGQLIVDRFVLTDKPTDPRRDPEAQVQGA
jgi:ABC-type transporter Mla subunit MlaD